MNELPNLDAALLTPPDLTALEPRERATHAPRILLLYGSLRERSFSRFLTLEAERLLQYLGAETRVFDPRGLPLPDGAPADHPKVAELRELSAWSEGQVWTSPERHGAMTGIMKAQIDWIPLAIGAVRPTQGKTLAVMQVSGGSQSFNAVNQLRVLGRWMRMMTIPNQSSVAKAYEAIRRGGPHEAVGLLRARRRRDGGAGEIHAADARPLGLPDRPLQRAPRGGRKARSAGEVGCRLINSRIVEITNSTYCMAS